MKPIQQLSLTEKAKFIHQLFPTQMPALIAYIKEFIQSVRLQERLYRKVWKAQGSDFDHWYAALGVIEGIVDRAPAKLATRPAYFARRLFTGPIALVSAYCVVRYAELPANTGSKFHLAVDLFIKP